MGVGGGNRIGLDCRYAVQSHANRTKDRAKHNGQQGKFVPVDGIDCRPSSKKKIRIEQMSTRSPGWKLDAPLAGHRPESDSNLSLAPKDKAPRSEKRRCQFRRRGQWDPGSRDLTFDFPQQAKKERETFAGPRLWSKPRPLLIGEFV